MMTVICANCERDTDSTEKCDHCGEEPTLRGRYELEGVVGKGASGTTYRARDTEEGRQVAIKEMGIHGIETFKAYELFEREADVLCRLDHPGIPAFHDYFEWGEGKALRFYLVMEFVEGKTLREELKASYYRAEEARDVIEKLAEIASYLHGLNPPVIHRDIKPSNVLRRPDGKLVLIDFGSVRDALEPDDSGSTIAGTIGYMAPEQLRGTATPASDVYGIGATVLHLLARREPAEFLGAGHGLDWEDHIDVSRRFRRLMRRMLTDDLDERIGEGDALIVAVEALSNEEEAPPKEKGRNEEDKAEVTYRTPEWNAPAPTTPPRSPPMRGKHSRPWKGLLSMAFKFGVGGLALVGFLTLSTCAACVGWLHVSDASEASVSESTGNDGYNDPSNAGPEVHELRAPRASAEPDVVLDATAEREVEAELWSHTRAFFECAEGTPVETAAVNASFGIEFGEPVRAEIVDSLPDDVESCLLDIFDEFEFNERRNLASVEVSIPLK